MSDAVALELNRDDALVLFDWLARRADNQPTETPLTAGEMVPSKILCDLEKDLAEILDPNYGVRC
jgi:hypothetical protein